jgi:agmatine deiminase
MSDASAPTPSQRGFRWPAEWEVHAGTWLTWPHNPVTWPGRLEGAERAYTEIVRALHGVETVNLLVADEPAEARVRARLAAHGVEPDLLRFHWIPTDDSWIRDYGPLFLVDDRGGRLAADFAFDAWGGKYPPWDRDAAAGRAVARAAGVERSGCETVLEGGALDGDGLGTVLTTGRCMLDPARGPGRTRESLEALLAEQLGAREVIWLEGEIAGDDTDGHVDQLARFVAPGTVAALPLAETLEPLRGARDARGRPLCVAELPPPPQVRVAGAVVPASHANFYLGNGVALVPVFGVPEDERALAVLGELLPDRQLSGIPCRELAVGLGAIHCVTQQEPAVSSQGTRQLKGLSL